MVVDRADLARFPADGDQFIKAGFVDQIAGVVLAVPREIRGKRFGRYGRAFQEVQDFVGATKRRFLKFAQLGNKVLNG